MTASEMITGIKLGLDKSSGLTLPAFTNDELYYWINRTIEEFVKTRYSGWNIKRESFEQNQKRTDDLRSLIKEDVLPIIDGSLKPNSYIADLYYYGEWDEEIATESLVEGRIYKVVGGDIRHPAEGTTYSEGEYFVAGATGTWDDGDPATGGYPVNGELYWITLGEESLIAYIPLGDSETVVTSGNLVSGSVYKVITDSITHVVEYEVGSYFVATSTEYTGDGSVIEVETLRVPIIDCSIDTYTQYLENPYSEHILHYDKAKPLRLFYQDCVELITDGTYGVIYYYLRYLKRPQEVSSVNDCDLPEHTHAEIVEMTVSTLLENIEHQRYQTHSVEVSKIE